MEKTCENCKYSERVQVWNSGEYLDCSLGFDIFNACQCAGTESHWEDINSCNDTESMV